MVLEMDQKKKRLGRGDHPNVRRPAQRAPAMDATAVGAIKNREMVLFEVRRKFDGLPAANVLVRRLDVFL